MARSVTPAVRRTAALAGVNLDTVTGTGVAGRVTVHDVRRAVVTARAVARPVASAPSSPRDPAFAANPLLDELRQRSPAVAAINSRRSPAPTLFASGDTPPYTASGNDPRALLSLPWVIRHAAAKADQATWARLFDDYGAGVPDAAVAAMAIAPEAGDYGNGEYRARFAIWSMGG